MLELRLIALREYCISLEEGGIFGKPPKTFYTFLKEYSTMLFWWKGRYAKKEFLQHV